MSGLTPEQIERLATAMHDSLDHCAHFDGIPGGGKQCSAYAHRIAPVVAALIAGAVEEARAEVAGAIEAERSKPDDHGRWSKAAYSAALTHAARIARGEVTP